MHIHEYNCLNSHIGYGSSNPEIVFIGLEEHCEAHSLHANYTYRFGSLPGVSGLHDLGVFHSGSPLPDMSQWFALPKRQMTWGNYSKFMIAYFGLHCTPIQYQCNHLGTIHGSTALLELYPFPRKNHSAWDPYLNVPHLGITERTYRAVCPDSARISALRKIVFSKNVRAVIMHGAINRAGTPKDDHMLALNSIAPLNFVTLHTLCNVGNNTHYAREYSWANGGSHVRLFLTHFFGMGQISANAIVNLASLI